MRAAPQGCGRGRARSPGRARSRGRGRSPALRPIIAISQRDKSKPARMKIRAGRFDRRGGGWGRSRRSQLFSGRGGLSFVEM